VPGVRPLLIGSLALAFVPKCPICLLAYFGAFGAAVAPLTVAWLAFTVITLAWKAEGRYGPALLAVLASIVILAGPFVLAGIAALFVAVIWRAHSQRRISCADSSRFSSSHSPSLTH